MHQTVTSGDAKKFQTKFTAFLQEHLSHFCVPNLKEKVYQALCFVLFYSLFDAVDRRYDVKMEQDNGHGRSDITAHPRTAACTLSLIFEIKRVHAYSTKNGKRQRKLKNDLRTELEKATVAALKQIESCKYRAGAPLHTTKIHEYGLAFLGKFGVAAVRTLSRHDGYSDWQTESHQSAVVTELFPVEEDDGEDEM
jgi:hypothetical protein